MSSKVSQLAKDLQQVMDDKDKRKTSPIDTKATVVDVEDDIVWVHFPGGIDKTPVTKTINAKKGDVVQVRASNGKAWIVGNATNPPTDDSTANYAIDVSTNVKKDVTVLNTVVMENIEATNARFGTVEADTAKIHNLTADQITASVGYIDDLTAGNVTAQNIVADHGTISTLDSTYATIEELHSDYAEIDLANVNNAWIQNGVIKDAAISDAQIIGVSANKLTAGTIDASNINVTNLNADNITAGSITVDGITIDIENNEATIDGEYIEDGTITMSGLAQSVQNAIDGAIETYTGSVVPTLSNYPASSWTTTKLKDSHIGDIYYVINAGHEADGYCYRFAKSGSTYSWVLIQDSDVTAALSRLTTAEGKIEGLETFESETSSWMTDTDEELSSVKTNVTSLSGRMDTAEGNIQQKVDTSTFNTLSQTVGENSSNITTLTTITENNGLTTSTNITNTVNNVSQTASGNSSKISQLTTTLGTNADGTTKAGDIVHQVSDIDQDLDSITTRVSKTEVRLNGQYATSSTGSSTTAKTATITPTLTGYTLEKGAIITVKFTNANTNSAPTLNVNSTGAKAIKTYSGGTLSEAEYKWPAGATMSFVYDGSYWRIQDSTELTRLSTAEGSISTQAGQIALKANASDVYDKTSTEALLEVKANKDTLTSEINASADTVKISANKVNITGVITAINDDTTTTIDGDKITTGTLSASAVNASSGTFDVANIPNLSASKITTGTITVDVLPDDALNSNVQVGGRNLLYGSEVSRQQSDSGTIDGGKFAKNVPSGSVITVSVQVDADNVTWASSGTTRVGCEFNLAKDGGGYQYVGAWAGKAVSESANIVEAFSGSFHKRISKTFTLLGDVALNTGVYLYIQGVSSGTVTVSNIQVEKGNKATDWSPAPEDVQAEIDAKKSIHTLDSSYNTTYQQLLNWSSSAYTGGFSVASTAGVKAGDTCRIKATVSDMGGAVVYMVVKVNSVTSSTSINATGCGLDTTVINGGMILANTIGANQIAANSIGAKHLTISDSTNLVTANEMYEASLPSALSNSYLPIISGGYLIKKTATQQYLMLTDYTSSNFKQNDELYYEFYGKADTAGSVKIAAFGYTGTPPTHTYSHAQTVAIDFTTTDTFYSGTLSLSNANWNTVTQYLLGFSDERSTKSQIYIRKLVIRRKNGGELIVDGSITADKIAANAVAIGKLDATTRNNLNHAYYHTAVYTFGNTNVGWRKIGHLKSGNAKTTIITLNTGNGYNGRADQNSSMRISIKAGNGASSAVVFGVTVEREAGYNAQVKVIATATGSNAQECDVYWYSPWNYNDGNYTVDGYFQTWTNDTSAVSAEPTGNSQEVVYRLWTDDYITEIDSAGIKIHAATNPTENYTQIDSNGLGIYVDGTNVAQYGTTAIIGDIDKAHTTITPSTIEMSTGSGATAFKVQDGGTSESQLIVQSIERTIRPPTGASTTARGYVSIATLNPSVIPTGTVVTFLLQSTESAQYQQSVSFTIGTNNEINISTNISRGTIKYYNSSAQIASQKNRVYLGLYSDSDPVEVVQYSYTKVTPLPLVETTGKLTAGKNYTDVNATSFIIGNGYSSSNTSNALTVSNTGVLALADVGNTFVETSHVILNNASIAAGGVSDSSLAITKTGYYPIAISGWYSSTRYIVTTQCCLVNRANGSATIDFMLYNPNSSARTGTVNVYVIWMKIA